MPENVVLLHGFGGTHRAWDGVLAHLDRARYLPRALDLPGHGEQRAGAAVTFEGCVEDVLARAPARFTLCGYSMGARIALALALAAPQRVDRLVLISASPGIAEEGLREQRRRSDAALAEELESTPYEDWIERWRGQPLFAHEPPQVRQLARADQRRNDPAALAAVLRAAGTGEMPSLWDRLAQLSMPLTLLVGARDEKFVAIAGQMAPLIPRCEVLVLDGGHGLVLERPAAVAAVLQRRLPQRAHPPGAAAPAL